MKKQLLESLHFTITQAIQTLASYASRGLNSGLTPEQKVKLADLYITFWRIVDLTNNLDKIRQHCTHALNHTHPEGQPYPQYDPFREALHRFGDGERFDAIHLPEDVAHLIRVFPEIQRRKGELLLFFSGELVDFRVKEDWSIEKKTPDELAEAVNNDYLSALEASFVAESWTLDLSLAKEIIEQRGDLQTAINLIS